MRKLYGTFPIIGTSVNDGSGMKLTDKQRAALKYASVYMRRFIDPTQSGTQTSYGKDWNKPQVWAALYRLGLVEEFRGSEQVRFERRQYWREYRITDAGRRALSSDEGGPA